LGESIPGTIIPGKNIVISPNGRMLASQAEDGIILRDLNTDKNIILETGDYTNSLTDNFSFYANGSRFAAIGEDGTLLTWDVSSSKPEILEDDKQPLKGKSNIPSVFSPDGRYLAYDSYGRIRIWDIEQGQYSTDPNDFPEAENSINTITFSSDGKLLAYSDGPKVLLWDLDKKEKLGDLLTASNTITRLSLIMKDSTLQYLVTADDSGFTQIWDWATRTRVGNPMPGSLRIVGINDTNQTVYYINHSLDSNGQVSETGRLIRWQWGLPVEKWRDILCPLVSRNLTVEEQNL
jgi:WD40 repeat protein